MNLTDEPSTFYEILDVKPEATPQEIRAAYLRVKNTYNKDSVALYTLISPGEREEMLQKIEEAYAVLSHPERRKEYDRYHGLIDTRGDLPPVARPKSKIISIDRVPPMDMNDGDNLLVAPSTDIGNESGGSRSPFDDAGEASSAFEASPFSREGAAVRDPAPVAPPEAATPSPVAAPAAIAEPVATAPAPAPTSAPAASVPPPAPPRSPAVDAVAALAREIESETEWKGTFLRRIRESRRISVEEMSASTKISKTYLIALEEDNYARLPAPVYVRGFVTQVARVLRLPHQQVATAYMARYNAAQTKS